MKKVLLTSTALVLSAGVAAAEVSLSGSAGIWLSDDGVSDTQVNNEIAIDFAGEGTTDSGLTMGFNYTLLDATGGSSSEVCVEVADDTVDTDPDTAGVQGDVDVLNDVLCATDTTGGGAAAVDDWEVYISGAFGKLTVGDTDDALQMVAGIGDIGYDSLGVDNVAEAGRGAGNADGILYQYNAGDFGIYLSHSKDLGDDDVAIGVSAAFGDFKIGVGYEDQGGTDYTAVDLSGSFGDMSFDSYFGSSDDPAVGDNYGVILSMGFGASTLKLGYADGDSTSDAAIAVGMDYDLGGATMSGGVGDVGGETVWELGISMDF